MAYLARQRIEDIYVALKHIANILARPSWLDPATGRLNINDVTNVATVASITNVVTVADSTNYGGQPILNTLVFTEAKASWALNIRTRIS